MLTAYLLRGAKVAGEILRLLRRFTGVSAMRTLDDIFEMDMRNEELLQQIDLVRARRDTQDKYIELLEKEKLRILCFGIGTNVFWIVFVGILLA